MLAACCITDFFLSTRADQVNAATAVVVANALNFAGIPLALYGVAAGLLQWIVPQVDARSIIRTNHRTNPVKVDNQIHD